MSAFAIRDSPKLYYLFALQQKIDLKLKFKDRSIGSSFKVKLIRTIQNNSICCCVYDML
jgi:hypothetical protein